MNDLLKFNNVNLDVLTETYNMSFYMSYMSRWPESFVGKKQIGSFSFRMCCHSNMAITEKSSNENVAATFCGCRVALGYSSLKVGDLNLLRFLRFLYNISKVSQRKLLFLLQLLKLLMAISWDTTLERLRARKHSGTVT
jgi:hypothetical protein